ncbi:DedA family protein [Candidatus Schneideria nysicola]|uniref:DedA family protein n=1 Tax=Candidatus Schneideria nysicola TaxID=1081631 RepID=UPI001CAA5C03|nr:DedA family protein [Candidatus Schneideria nysicola]UAJ65873.1 DedA family protein [Candidatus Schneideria nysicola]
MSIINSLLYSYNEENFFHSNLVWSIYIIIFVILILENGIIPASFLPGDSLLIFVGLLVSKGVLNLPITLFLLTTAAGIGSWISYLQGKWLRKNRKMKKWLIYLPNQSYQKTYNIFYRYGLSALFFVRFIVFARTLLPILVGFYGLSNIQFQLFNWISAFFWVLVLVLLGFFIGENPFFQIYEKNFLLFLLIVSAIFIIIGITSFILIYIRKIKEKKNN